MEVVFGLLLTLLGVSHGVETYCDGRTNLTQCYGALGGTVELRLMDSATERFTFNKHKTTIFSWRNNKTDSNDIENRSVFTPSNGTLRINNMSRTDTDVYELTIRHSDGTLLEQRTFNLTIQAPVSSVLLVSECLFQGQMRVSCSSLEGDTPQYNWTLDGHTLTDTELLAGNNETDNITLAQHVSGRLVCSVRNRVSNSFMEKRISTCGFIFINCTISNQTLSKWVFAANNTLCIEPTTTPSTVAGTTVGKKTAITVSVKPSKNITTAGHNGTSSNIEHPWFINNLPIIAGVLAALVALLVVGGAVICVQKKKKNNTPKEEADEQELTYADVTAVERRQVQQRAEVEVEYGQIQFSDRPRRIVEPTGEECVYAKVR